MKTFFALFVLLFSSLVFAECTSGNCTNGYGTYVWDSGAKYVGEFKNSERHGQGTYIWDDGALYIGEFKNNEPNGKGYTKEYIAEEKLLTQYIGEFKDGLRNGQGIVFTTLGLIRDNNQMVPHTIIVDVSHAHIGEFKDAMKHGQGIESYSNGDVFLGEWKNNVIEKKISLNEIINNNNSLPLCELDRSETKRPSLGDFVLTKTKCFLEIKLDSIFYGGEFENGNLNGLGLKSFDEENKHILFGEWKDGNIHGLGRDQRKAGGLVYIGYFKMNDPSYGYLKKIDGEYLGGFKNGSFNGFGYSINKEGHEYVGEWQDGDRHGQGKMFYANGAKYDGEWKVGLRDGQGKMFHANGDKYDGEFQDDFEHGRGIYTTEDGDIIKIISVKGETIEVPEYLFANGDVFVGGSKYIEKHKLVLPHGFGTLTLVSGEKYEGEWFEGWLNISENEAISFSGAKYFGSIQNKLPNGLGKAIKRKGDMFEGEWVNGSPLKGKATLISGETYEGEYKNYERHGFGILIDKDGKRFEGMFENGEFVK